MTRGTEYLHGMWQRSWTLLGSKYGRHLYLVHTRNAYHEPWSSGPTPRHIWRLQYGQTSLTLKYGTTEAAESVTPGAEG